MNSIAIIICLLSIVSFGGAATEEVEILSASCSSASLLSSPTCDNTEVVSTTNDIGNESTGNIIKQQKAVINISEEEMFRGEVVFSTTVDSWWKEYDSDDEIYQKLDLYKEYECTINHDRPVPSTEDYMIMRQAYIDAVGPEESSIAIPASTKDGFLVPHEAHANDQTKGRGIFATEFIPKGTKMYQYGISGYAIFYDGNHYRKFLSLIPKEFACDVLIWSYADYDDDEDGGEVYISVELDDSALCNDDLSINKEEWNFGCNPTIAKQYDDIDCEEYAIALQDIQPGQEILCNYENFHSWEAWFALLGLS